MENIDLSSSSSDSEGDCYGGVVQKLQSLKNKYMEDKVENVLLLKPNTDIDEIIKQNSSLLENHQNNISKLKRVTRRKKTKQKENDDDDLSFDGETTQNRGRVTRRNTANSSNAITDTDEELDDLPECTSRRGASASRRRASVSRRRASTSRRGANTSRRRASTSRGSVCSPRGCQGASICRSRSATPRRVRGRIWRGRRRWCERSSLENYSIPVGDIDYPDQSSEQPLFSNPTIGQTQECMVIENEIVDPLSDNEELSVKVFWQNCDIFKFKIKRYQKLSHLFDFFSKRESMSYDKLLLTYNGRILKPSHTPDSIDYSVAKFIDGGIVKNSVTDLSTGSPTKSQLDLISIKFQSQIRKHPLEIKVFLDEKFSVALVKCAEQLDISVDRLKFYFDGDIINPQSTPRELEFEGGECIDVKFVD